MGEQLHGEFLRGSYKDSLEVSRVESTDDSRKQSLLEPRAGIPSETPEGIPGAI